MLKKDYVNKFVKLVAAKHGLTLTQEDAKTLFESFCELAAASLVNNGEMFMPGVGKVKIRKCKERTVHHPKTGQVITIPAKKRAVFVSSKKLKEDLAKG